MTDKKYKIVCHLKLCLLCSYSIRNKIKLKKPEQEKLPFMNKSEKAALGVMDNASWSISASKQKTLLDSIYTNSRLVGN